jgi:hypothetical protein
MDPTSSADCPPKRVLFICGSGNQTTQMQKIAREMHEVQAWFAPYLVDGLSQFLLRIGGGEFTIGGNRWRRACLSRLRDVGVAIDETGERHDYDLVVSCSDLFVPNIARQRPGVLVQEGMTDPPSLALTMVQRVRWLPRWLAGTAATGLSDWYLRFCVASEGFRDLFVKRGVRKEKVVVTGIPNFDDCKCHLDNDFPHRGYVLVCTSDSRETLKRHDRRKFIDRALHIARGRPLLFKLHPNEQTERAVREIRAQAPHALVFTEGTAEPMIANCDVLLTEYSSTAFVGLALGKEVHSAFATDELRRLLPLQNGAAARRIADVCREVLSSGIRAEARPGKWRRWGVGRFAPLKRGDPGMAA